MFGMEVDGIIKFFTGFGAFVNDSWLFICGSLTGGGFTVTLIPFVLSSLIDVSEKVSSVFIFIR
jgi:hypothetical protein